MSEAEAGRTGAVEAQWERLRPLLAGALERSGAERLRFLEQACAGDEPLRKRILELLAADESDPGFLSPAPLATALGALQASVAPRAGATLGPWRLLAPLGEGGMGVVWSAERADGAFELRVAVKLLRFGLGARQAELFRRERQVLAGLDHPGIARLLDGGVTAGGVPYLVLEHVEGTPVDVYCRERGLDVEATLRLFLAVCAAVSHAHERLVVHRDLKPANVLVRPDGTPKLLDFGIAKLLGERSLDDTRGDRALTPRHAAPEQLRGEPAGTATDVYALGSLLFLLLSGRPPFELGTDLAAWTREVVEQPAPRPSAVAPAGRQRRLRGDLDAIVGTALRKEPAERYPSADALAEDVRRHLEGEPVRARPASLGLRARAFVRRNPLVAASGILLFLALAGWAATATAHAVRVRRALAEAERERTRAVAAEDAARRSLADVQAFARTLLFEVHDAIERLPGATEARARVIETTLDHLQRLEPRAGDDPGLLRYLVEGYERLGDLQAGNALPGRGALEAADEAYRRALELLERLAAADGLPPEELARRRSVLLARRGAVQADAGQAQAARESLEAAGRGLAPEGRQAVALAVQRADLLQREGRHDEALATLREARAANLRGLAALDAAPDEHAAERSEWRRDGVLVELRIAELQRLRRAWEEAETAARAATTTLRELSVERPDDAQLAGDLADALCGLAAVFGDAGRPAEAMPLLEEACALQRALVAADPANVNELTGLVRSLGNLATTRLQQAESEAGLEAAREAVEWATLRVERTPEHPGALLSLGFALHDAGWLARVAGEPGEARERLELAAGLAAELRASDPEAFEPARLAAMVASQQGYGALERGEARAALESFRSAEEGFERLVERWPAHAYCQREHMVARSCIGVAAEALAREASDPASRRALLEEARDAYAWSVERQRELAREGHALPSDARAAELFEADRARLEEELAGSSAR